MAVLFLHEDGFIGNVHGVLESLFLARQSAHTRKVSRNLFQSEMQKSLMPERGGTLHAASENMLTMRAVTDLMLCKRARLKKYCCVRLMYRVE